MALVPIPIRYMIDEYFLEWLLEDKELAVEIIEKLSDIHKTSEDHPLTHNIIFDDSFKSAIKTNKVRGTLFLGAMHPEPYPNFLKSETEQISKIIRYSINLANKRPFRVVILTSKEQQNNYLENEHYSRNLSPAVEIETEQEAIRQIRTIHNVYCKRT